MTRVSRSFKRNVSVFLAWIRIAFVFEGAERSDDAGARVGGLDDRVDVAALGGNEGIGETVAKFSDFFLTELFALGFGNLSSSRLLTMLRRLRDP